MVGVGLGRRGPGSLLAPGFAGGGVIKNKFHEAPYFSSTLTESCELRLTRLGKASMLGDLRVCDSATTFALNSPVADTQCRTLHGLPLSAAGVALVGQ